jgi:ABC-type protease/lipase transport system fused ATPase/permease subunit
LEAFSLAIKPKSDELGDVLQACRRYFLIALIFSLAINLLYLASPLYMLQVYDRVVSSASEVTLVMLTILLLLTLATLAAIDSVRARLLTRASLRLDRLLASRIVAATMEVAARGVGVRSQPLRDFDTFRQFITGSGIHAIFDMPWTPIYLGVIFILHPLLGSFALGSAVVLVLMAFLNEHLTKGPLAGANEAAIRNYALTDMS